MSGPEVIPTSSPEAMIQATALLARGDVIAAATDTVYGLVAIAADDLAIRRIFELKRRPVDRQLPILIADLDQAEKLIELPTPSRALAEKFWPGPLTIVAPRCHGAPGHLGDDGTIGVRCPADPWIRELATRVGPLAATSANHHGHDTPITAEGVAELMPELGMVADGGSLTGEASTVVDVSGESPIVLRNGPISLGDIQGAGGWKT